MASIAKRSNGQWRARYRDAAGREHARHFRRKIDAQSWLDEITASVVTGHYVDPRSGKITFREYAETWRAAQVHRPGTARHTETTLRLHTYPILGDRTLTSIRPSEIQSWVKGLPLAPSTAGVAFRIVSGVFRAAVRDKIIPSNPCDGTKLPQVHRPQIQPLPVEAVEGLAEAVPPQLRALIVLCAGTGLRQGEAFGLTVDRVDFLRRTLRVDRQLTGSDRGRPVFGPPKTPSSVRTIPLPSVVVEALAEHIRVHGTGQEGLLFVGTGGVVLRRA